MASSRTAWVLAKKKKRKEKAEDIVQHKRACLVRKPEFNFQDGKQTKFLSVIFLIKIFKEPSSL